MTGKIETVLPFLRKGERIMELQADEFHFCAWEDHSANPPGRVIKAHAR